MHSCHSYFLRPGKIKQDVIYDVEVIRDGKSISTRRVAAIQNGKPILYMSVSFEDDIENPKTLEAQRDVDFMETIPAPETLQSEYVYLQDYAHLIPENARSRFLSKRAIEIRPVHFFSPTGFEPCEAKRYVWIKASEPMPSDPDIHQCSMLYASDMNLLAAALQPFGKTVWMKDLAVASIDHSVWMHSPNMRLDKDWLLYSVVSPITSRGRGFSLGHVYTRSGRLIMTAAQEGVTRIKSE
eukprot:g1428.t1